MKMVVKILQYFSQCIDILRWKSKGLPDESIKSPITYNYSLAPELSYYGTKTRVKLHGSCLKQDKILFTHGTILDIQIVYEISNNFPISNYPTLEN